MTARRKSTPAGVAMASAGALVVTAVGAALLTWTMRTAEPHRQAGAVPPSLATVLTFSAPMTTTPPVTPTTTVTVTAPVSPTSTTDVPTAAPTTPVTPTMTVAASATLPITTTPTLTATVGVTSTATPTLAVTETPNAATDTPTVTRTPSATLTPTSSPSATLPPIPTVTVSPSPTDSPSATPSPVPTTAPPANAPVYLPVVMRWFAPLDAGVFGIQISENRFRDPAMIRAVRDAGASWLRTFVFWDEIEPLRTWPATYDWSLYDPLLGTAAAEGMTIIAEIQGNPRWVAAYPGGPPDDLDALAQFVAAAVERYDGDGDRDAPGHPRVRYWELYNEPDNVDARLASEGRGWGYWGYRGAEYARMLKRVYPAVKIASRQAQVLLGGLAYEEFSGASPFNPEFLDDVLEAGGGDYFDLMNFHYYPLFAPRWARYGLDIAGKTEAVRIKLAQYHLTKPIVATEAGSWSWGSPPYPVTSAEEQARYVPQLHARALSAGLALVCWFQYDDVAGADDPARGLIDRDLAAKPALATYRLTARLLAGARPETPCRDPGAAGEVYWFRRGDVRIAVAWTNDETVVTLPVRAGAVERTRSQGGASLVATDASDGRVDGVTHVPYGSEPVFLRLLEAGRLP
jgi:hypothetical protein